MPRNWLETLIKESYIPRLKKLKDTPEGQKEAKRFTREIRTSWAKRGLKELSQQQGCMDDLRRAIKQALGADHFSLEFVKFSTAEYTKLNDQKQNRVATRNENIQYITDPDAIVATAVRLLESPEWSEIAAGLSVLTGRRIAELLSTAEFSKKTQWSVTFTGALKRRGELKQLAFEIPTLTTADRVITALAKVRKELPETQDMPAVAINRSYEQAVIRAVDKHFAGIIPTRHGKDSLYTHANRAVYAVIAEFWYCPRQVNGTEYRATIQGHYAILDENNPELRRSLAASRHYADFEIADSVIAKYNGQRKGIKLGVSGIEPIEVFRKAHVEADKMTPQAKKKVRSGVHLWQSDKVLLETLWERLGLTGSQQDRMHQFLFWVQREIDRAEEMKKNVQGEGEPGEGKEAATIAPTPAPTPTEASLSPGLEGQIGALVTTMNRFMELQMNQAVKPPAAFPKRTDVVSKPVASSNAVSTGSTDSPQKTRRTSTTQVDETIANAINAIMNWNDAPDRLHDDKWAITINGIKSFTPSQRKITQALQDRAEAINAHHQKHQIDPAKHNLRHRGKTNITEVIKLVDTAN